MTKKALNVAFREIRNYLAGKAIGITRDKSLMHEVVKCLFCKVNYPEIGINRSDNESLARLYHDAFTDIKSQVQSIFSDDEQFLLDPASIGFIHDTLSEVDLDDPRNDPLSELYQAFVSSDARGAEGQFFTPTGAVSWLVDAIAPQKGEKIIDPACGAGSFLSYSARHMRANGVSHSDINAALYGIEKDTYLSKLANTHIALSTFGESNVVCADSIERKDRNGDPIPFELDEHFDVVLANPPFGSKIKIGSDDAKRQFDLAHRWTLDKKTGRCVKSEKLATNPTPQILFIELCLKLLKPGGRMGVVVPESMLSSSTGSYVVQYLLEHARIDAVAGMPENLFKTSGKGGTHTKTCLMLATKKSEANDDHKIFMAEAKWCGHDSRGNNIPHDDLPIILDNFRTKKKPSNGESHLGYYLTTSDIRGNVLAPRYYNPEPVEALNLMKKTHDLICLGDLVEQGVVEIKVGDEVGKLAYGTGTIPFVRTSDISNWELKTDPKHGLSEAIYQKLSKKQDVRAGDILMVKDGTYLIGTCAYVTKYDEKIVYQSHLYKIRVKDETVISPYLLLAALSSKPVIDQIQSKRFTQDIIDSIGKRVLELVLPIPKDKSKKKKVESIVKTSIDDRVESRELTRKAKIYIADID
ncbi:N-6 DNA methylase [Ectothiorhodospira marina]|uniref:Type I restriction enzyme M protein n=1 Tax=Ectothiorhodospira marina TaxID=1396821 RepID=A0A1H7N7A5_9GAMM|nr:N-6 DNA methylase [Ectothiorhodospira marina]SEL19360.1 type I restriction enzyme M protein [Ectothiorhodospira marina]